MELKELIEKRWQASAAGYGESIRKELSDEREKWKAYIQKKNICGSGQWPGKYGLRSVPPEAKAGLWHN